ncbi:MAG: sialate O-acetylesterase [Phycisphaerales bacterium]|jgi:hypothetical protein|nr:sialate O-acetylesterase [Planctomycetota bacterium]
MRTNTRILAAAATASLALSASTTTVVAAEPPPSTGEAKAVRVFLLAGQSNMEGHGVVDLDHERDYNGGRGNLVEFLASDDGAPWRDLRSDAGGWTERDDVFVSYLTERGELKSGPLSIGFGVHSGRHHIGPELGIGLILGDAFDEPVLLVKTCWGGKSLAKDFRPPSAGGEVGPYYRRMLAEYRQAIATMAERFPALAGRTPKLEGVVWFQGWNDACDRDATATYAANLKHLVADLRTEFDAATLPVVVGETGNWDGEQFRSAQREGCEGLEAVVFVPTRRFLRPAESCPNRTHGHHWYGSGGSYLQAGDAMGRAMRTLTSSAGATEPSAPSR